MQRPNRILMVCLGNICRSPMAEGILRKKLDERGLNLTVDSAGTSSWHEGEQPDERAMAEMDSRGIDISHQRSRPFTVADFDHFDKIFVMDASNYENVLSLARSDGDKSKVSLILDEVNVEKGRSVPDPYYNDAFDHVHDLLDEACEAFIQKI